MVASFYKSMKYYWIIRFKWVNGGPCGLYQRSFCFFQVLQPSPAPSANTARFRGHNVIKRWGLAAHRSKASKQARLVERKVCYISSASNWWGRVANICPKADSPHDKQGVRASIDRVEGVTCRNSIVISNRHLQLVISGLTSIILVF